MEGQQAKLGKSGLEVMTVEAGHRSRLMGTDGHAIVEVGG